MPVPAPGVMLAGEKAQLRFAGRESHESEMLLLYEPDCGVAETVILADVPTGIVTAVGDAVKVRLAPPLEELQAGV